MHNFSESDENSSYYTIRTELQLKCYIEELRYAIYKIASVQRVYASGNDKIRAEIDNALVLANKKICV